MKKALIFIALTLALIIALAPKLLGFSVFHLGHALQVATSMSAKLACSGRYVTGLDESTAFNDLSSYSPVTKLVDLQYSDNRRVNASLFGISQAEAIYTEGLGCRLNLGDTAKLDDLTIPQLTSSAALWPQGESVSNIQKTIQDVTDKLVLQDNQQGFITRALLVVKDGKLIAESYGDGITASSKLLGWSMAKSVTAMLLARMQHLAIIDTNPDKLFLQWQDQRRRLTLNNLLTMTSGLKFDETYAPGTDATHMLFTAYSASDVAQQSPLHKKPGEFFSYSSGTTNLLSRYIHQQLGDSTQADINFLYQQLFQPLNMTNSVFETDSSGVFVGSSYLYASGRDWARLGLLMLNKGQVNGQQLLPEGWTEQAQTPNNSDNEKAYGYQFWLNRGDKQLRWPSLPDDAYAMRGNRKQSVMIIPSENTVLVRLGWTKGDYPMEQNYRIILDAL